MIRTLIIAAALIVGLAAVPARAEQFAVIDSSVPAVPPGSTVSSGTSLDIPAAGHIVLVAGSGTVLTLKGPYKGPPKETAPESGAASGDVVTIIASLVGNSDQRQTAGVVRATDTAWRQEAATSPAAVLAIDATDGGDACIYDAGHARLTHNPAHSGTMSIEAMNGGAKAEIDWPQDTLSLPWPAALPLADGDNFLFHQKGEDAVAVATVHVLPAAAAGSDVARAMQVAKAGCRDQARLLVALIAKAAK